MVPENGAEMDVSESAFCLIFKSASAISNRACASVSSCCATAPDFAASSIRLRYAVACFRRALEVSTLLMKSRGSSFASDWPVVTLSPTWMGRSMSCPETSNAMSTARTASARPGKTRPLRSELSVTHMVRTGRIKASGSTGFEQPAKVMSKMLLDRIVAERLDFICLVLFMVDEGGCACVFSPV
jgi:hypothetical protein